MELEKQNLFDWFGLKSLMLLELALQKLRLLCNSFTQWPKKILSAATIYFPVVSWNEDITQLFQLVIVIAVCVCVCVWAEQGAPVGPEAPGLLLSRGDGN